MALTKTQAIDKIEIVTEYRHIQIRTATIIKEDGKELSRSFTRRVLHAGTLDGSDNLVDTDVSSESAEIQGIASTVWTTDVKNSYKAFLIANKS